MIRFWCCWKADIKSFPTKYKVLRWTLKLEVKKAIISAVQNLGMPLDIEGVARQLYFHNGRATWSLGRGTPVQVSRGKEWWKKARGVPLEFEGVARQGC